MARASLIPSVMELLPVELVELMPVRPVVVVAARCCKAPLPQLPERLIRSPLALAVAMAETAETLRFHQLRLLAVATRAVGRLVDLAAAAIQVEIVAAARWLAVAVAAMVAPEAMQMVALIVAAMVALAHQ